MEPWGSVMSDWGRQEFPTMLHGHRRLGVRMLTSDSVPWEEVCKRVPEKCS